MANRLYYAAYYAVSALLIANHIPAHTHDGNINQFGLHFIKTGVVDKTYGKLLRRLFSMRLTGDYSDRFDLVEDDVQPLMEPTERFIQLMESMAMQNIS